MLSLLIFLLVTGILLIVMEPFFTKAKLPNKFLTKRQLRQKSLSVRLEQLYEGIKELELDYQMGKIAIEDYRRLDGGYKRRIETVVKELKSVGTGKHFTDIKKQIETEALLMRKTKDKVEVKESVNCSKCKEENLPDSNFCSKCGAKIN